MQWSNEMWTAVIVAFFVGAVVGYFILLTTNANAKKQQALEVELKQTTEQLNAQKQQLEKHFEQSATLLATLAEDYKKLYTHLAESSQTLLPETTEKLAFFQNAQLENKAEASENSDDQPKDYSEGSSGILKS